MRRGGLDLLTLDSMRYFSGGSAAADSAAYTNFAARTSGLDATHLAAYKALLDGLTTDGFFDGSGVTQLLDCLYVFCTADATTAKLNLIQNNYNCTVPNGEPTFTADTGGYTGVSNKYLSSGFNASTATTPKYVQDSANIFVWCNSSAQDSVGNNTMGTVAGGTNGLNVRNTSNQFQVRLNSSTTNSVANSDAKAFWNPIRTSSSNVDIYKDGASWSAGNSATSAAVINSNMTFLVGTGFSTAQIFAGGWGALLSGTQAANLYARIHTYLQTIAGIA